MVRINIQGFKKQFLLNSESSLELLVYVCLDNFNLGRLTKVYVENSLLYFKKYTTNVEKVTEARIWFNVVIDQIMLEVFQTSIIEFS